MAGLLLAGAAPGGCGGNRARPVTGATGRGSSALLLRRHRFVQDRWGWELPGGLIDEGEEPAETAVRELEEETGYRAGQVEHLITFQPMVGMVDSEHVVFVGRAPEKVAEPTEVNEIERMEWVPLASVPQLIAAGEIWNAGSLVALLQLIAKGA